MGRLAALALVVSATVVWGATFSVVKGALADAGALTFLALRFCLAAILVAPLARGRGWLRPTRPAVLCGLALYCGFALQTAGLASTTPARCAFLTALSAVLVPWLEPLLGLGRFAWRALLGGVLAAAGLAVLLRPGGGGISLGDVLTLGCAVAFAGHVLLLQLAVRNTAPARVNALQVVIPALLALPVAGLEGWRFALSCRLVGAVLLTAGLATVAAFWAVTAAQRVVSASETSVVLAFEPVVAAVISVALGMDRFTVSLAAGGALVVAGVFAATVRRGGSPDGSCRGDQSGTPWLRTRLFSGRRGRSAVPRSPGPS
jgi:drug/metabolite transporter (DMT)-like permease